MYVDLHKAELICKIVYFGPGLSGKTTNLDYLQQHAPSDETTDLVHIDRSGERTLAFSLYPLEAPDCGQLRCRVDLLTVPGRAYYITNRRDILDGADGIVFIADSRREAIDENIDAMNDMWSFINHNQLAGDIPIVIQFNKQDLDSAIPLEQLEPLLNSQGQQSFGASATTGTGVIETMQAILELALPRITEPKRIAAETEHAQEMGGTTEPQHHIVSSTIQVAGEDEESWLLTCAKCDAVLEVVDVHAGDLFACGSCNTMLEVVDPNTGETRIAPPPEATPTPAHTVLQTPTSGGQVLPPPVGPGTAEITPTGSLIPNTESDGLPQLPGMRLQDQIDVSLLGTRYRAINQDDQRQLRILVLNPVALRQPGYAESLDTHHSKAVKIRHNHILPTLGMQIWNNLPVFISELPSGFKPLSLLLSRRRRLAPPQAMGIIRQLALGLEEAAHAGVIHGWIRPEVVLINESGQIMLDELTVAKHPPYILRESMGGSASTEHYLAPEHLHGESTPDTRSDIFMLGALLFRMITGEGLITGYTAHEALHKVVTSGVRSIRDANPDISRELDAFYTRLATIDRKDRLQRHSEVIAYLEKFGGGAHRGTVRVNKQPTVASVSSRQPPPARGGGSFTPMRSAPVIERHGAHGTRRIPSPTRATTDMQGSAKRRHQPTFGPLLLLALIALLLTIVYFMRPELRQQLEDPRPEPEPTAAPISQTPPPTTPESEPQPSPETEAQSQPGPSSNDDPIALANTLLKQLQRNPTDQALLQRLRTMLQDLRLSESEAQRDAAASMLLEVAQLAEDGQAEPTIDVAAIQADIRKLIQEEHFAQALERNQAIPDEEARQQNAKQIQQLHDEARKSLETLIAGAKDETALVTLLKPATRWNMPGDADWLQQLATQARERLQQAPTPEQEHVAPKADLHIQTVDGLPIAMIMTDVQVDAALRTRDFRRAENLLQDLPADHPLVEAMQLKIQLQREATSLMEQARQGREGPFRIKTPFGDQQWDVVSMSEDGLNVRSSADEVLALSWSQVEAGDLGRLYQAIAKAGNENPAEHATAAVGLLVGGNAGLASLAATTARKLFYDDFESLERLLHMQGLRTAAELVRDGERALEQRDAELLRTVQQGLQNERLEFTELAAARARFVPTILTSAQQPSETDPGPVPIDGDNGLVDDGPIDPGTFDNVTFAQVTDLAALPRRRGLWQVRNNALHCLEPRGTADRSDLLDSSGLNITVANGSDKGSATITFRGTSLTLDYARGGFFAGNNTSNAGFTTFPLISDIPYSISFALTGSVMQISINQTKTLKLVVANVDERLNIEVFDTTAFQIQQLVVQRNAENATNDQEWQMIGPAQVQGNGWLLPEPGSMPAAILRPIAADESGLKLEAAGDGPLTVRLGDLDTGAFYEVDVTLPAEGGALPIEIRWRDGRIAIMTGDSTDPAARPLVEDVMPVQPRHIMLQARRALIIPNQPVALRR